MTDIQIVVSSQDYETKIKILRSIDRHIQDMSISEICAKNHISKQTFYRYFHSKYDIGLWYADLCCQNFLYQAGRKYKLHEALNYHFAMISKETGYFAHSVTGKLRQEFCKVERQTLESELRATLENCKKIVIDDELAFCIGAASELIVNYTSDWARKDIQFYGSEKMVAYLIKCIPEPLQMALDKGL